MELPPFLLPGVGVTPVGQPSDPSRIRIWVRENKSGSIRLSLDNDRPFAVGPLPFGRYLLGAEHSSGCREDWIPTLCDSSDMCDAVSVEVDASDPSPRISFPLQRGATIEGLIVGLPDLVRADLVWEGKSYCDGGEFVFSDGFFAFSGLRPGSYRMRIELRDRTFLWYPGVESEEEAEVIEIREGEERIWIEMIWPD
jgi:hypothetical protein